MSTIVFADRTSAYDGHALDERPLGGTESSVTRLARELAARGHAVSVHTRIERAATIGGVDWRPLTERPAPGADLYVPVQQPSLLGFAPRPRKRALWVLWMPNNLKHYKQIGRMWRYRPIPVLMSRVQEDTYSRWLPARTGQVFLPLALPDEVRNLAPLASPPRPRAIFASNPSRNLHRLVRIWADRILPRVPGAVLDVYGVSGLGPSQDPWEAWKGRHLPDGLPAQAKTSVRIHEPVGRAALKEAMRAARVIPYLGHKSEAFCLTLAEAQALGVPAVVARIGALPERVVDGVTGFHRDDDAGFAEATVALLTDDALWRRQHEAAIRLQQGWSWRDYADRFEAELIHARP
ncbi:MAG: glycosyltransferase family 4 protein [Bauldia sp.]|nr:glycosyltransferase family 4 protein [Bauldia sp.]